MVVNFFKKMATAVAFMALMAGGQEASAQYYELANQLPKLISPALSGSMGYKGYVEFSGLAGFGDNRANIIGLSTSQGFQYSSWFFMGAGIGVDVAMVHLDDNRSGAGAGELPGYWSHSSATTKVMIPLFSDFRFNIGSPGSTSFFIDLKLGAMWLIGDSYLRLQHGCMTGDAQFYLKPSLGVRVPVSSANPRQAINVGVVYQLITSNNNYNYWNDSSLMLNAIGLSVAFEW